LTAVQHTALFSLLDEARLTFAFPFIQYGQLTDWRAGSFMEAVCRFAQREWQRHIRDLVGSKPPTPDQLRQIVERFALTTVPQLPNASFLLCHIEREMAAARSLLQQQTRARLPDACKRPSESPLAHDALETTVLLPLALLPRPIRDWTQMGLGYVDNRCWCFTPCPAVGAVVQLSEAQHFTLSGRHWPVLLHLLGHSTTGLSVTLPEPKQHFDLRSRSPSIASVLTETEQVRSMVKVMTRQFRTHVRGPDQPPLSVHDGDVIEITSAFQIRPLITERDQIHFGNPAPLT
jgi:hypothetical protein